MDGRSDAEWDQRIAARTEFLDECVRSGLATSYPELNNKLVERTGTRAFDFFLEKDRAAVGYLLGQIVKRDFPTRRFMLSAVVRYSETNDAGSGVLALAQQIGCSSPASTAWCSGPSNCAVWVCADDLTHDGQTKSAAPPIEPTPRATVWARPWRMCP